MRHPIALLFVLLAACSPQEERGGLEIQTREGGTVTHVETLDVDFGAAFPGAKAIRALVLTNSSSVPLELERFEVLSGSVGFSDAAFTVAFRDPVTIAPRESTKILLHFHAGEGGPASQSEAVASVRFFAAEQRGAVTVSMKGRVLRGACELPPLIDFGSVMDGDYAVRQLNLSNPSDLPVEVAFRQIVPLDHEEPLAFTLVEGFTPGTIVVPPQTTQSLELRYAPAEPGVHTSELGVTLGSCESASIRLEGTTTPYGVKVSGTGDCGAVPVGAEKIIAITFSTQSSEDVELSGLTFDHGAFDLVGGTTSVTVPRGGSVSFPIACRPDTDGVHEGSLSFRTPLPRQPTGAVSLRVFGGGPVAQISPPSLDFGDVPFHSGSPAGRTYRRSFFVTNEGTASGPSDYLRFPGSPLIAGGSGTAPGVFEAAWVSEDFDPARGLAPGESLEIEVRFSPNTVGDHSAEVSVVTNQHGGNPQPLAVSGRAVLAGPCQYELEPSVIDFGRLQIGSRTRRSTSLLNSGTETCWVGLDSIDGDGFSSDLSTALVRVEPGERMLIPATLQVSHLVPGGPRAGKLTLFVSAPSPQVEIPLTADLGEDCLFVAPGDFDLGPVTLGCASPTRTVRVYNTCLADIVLTGLSATSLGGPPGCAASPACAEFDLPAAHATLNPTTIAPNSSTTFTLRHLPIDENTDLATVALTWNRVGGVAATTVTTFRARGVPTDSREETLAISQQADVLLTLDNSGSGMTQVYDNEVIPEFTDFFEFAKVNEFDWRLGVSTSDMNNSQFKGRLQSGVGHPDKILTANSPGLQTQWAEKLRVGYMWSALEATVEGAMTAVLPPLAFGENEGLLRDDASLGILVMTNAPDQNSVLYMGATMYLDRLLSVKGFNRPNALSFSGIVPIGTPGPSCYYDTTRDDGRFETLIQATGGASIDVCSPDVDAMMATFGERVMGRRERYFLSQVPSDPAAISLRTSGGALPAQGPQGVLWSYDPVTNAIVFTPGEGPLPGAPIQVGYTTACLAP